VLYLSEPNEIAVASGDEGTFKVFDGATYLLVKTVGALDDADNVRFDPNTKLIYVGYAEGALAVIDAATMKPIIACLSAAANRLGSLSLTRPPASPSPTSPFPATPTTCSTTRDASGSTCRVVKASWMSSTSATPTPISCARGFRPALEHGLPSSCLT
jgi:hypothetical protein